MDLRIVASGAFTFGQPCKPIYQKAGKAPISVSFELERVDTSIAESDRPPGIRWDLESFAVQNIIVSRYWLPKTNNSFDIDLNTESPDRLDDYSEKFTAAVSITVRLVFRQTDIATNTEYTVRAVVDKPIDYGIPFQFYKTTASHVVIDSYTRRMQVWTQDVVITGSTVNTTPRSGVRVAPMEPHVGIVPEQTTTGADGIARFQLVPFPPTDSAIYLATFTFDTDISDKILSVSSSVYYGTVKSVAGEVSGPIGGDIFGPVQRFTLGHSVPSGTGGTRYPSVQLELNDTTLAKLASKNDAVQGSSLDLGRTAERSANLSINSVGLSSGKQSWLEWSIQRVAVKGLLSLTPWSWEVTLPLGILLNYDLDHSLFDLHGEAAASDGKVFGSYNVTGAILSDGTAITDNQIGSAPVQVRGPAGTLILPPLTRLSVGGADGAMSTGPIPPLCTFPHGIAIQQADGSSVSNLEVRNPRLRVAHSTCGYLEESLQITIDGVSAEFDSTSTGDYSFLSLRPVSFLLPGTHALVATMIDHDGVVKTSAVEAVVADNAIVTPGIPDGLVAIPGKTAIGLRWQSGDPAVIAGYQVYRQTGTAPVERLTVQPVVVPTFFDSSLPVGTIGTYTVTAVSRTGTESAGSAAVATALETVGPWAPPPDVTGLSSAAAVRSTVRTAKSASLETIQIRFSSGIALSWKVERSTSAGGPFVQLAGPEGQVTDTTARDTQAVAGVQYWYRITSIGADAVQGTPAVFGPLVAVDGPPPVPDGLVGFNQQNFATLSWFSSSANDIAGYHVYRATTTSGFMRVTDTPITSTTFRDRLTSTALPNWYRVTAVDGVGNESAPTTAVLVSFATMPAQLFIPSANGPRIDSIQQSGQSGTLPVR